METNDQRMELISPDFDDLPANDTINKWNYLVNNTQFVHDYSNFRPQLVFHSFSRQENTWVTLIEQKPTGRENPKYDLKMENARMTLLGQRDNKRDGKDKALAGPTPSLESVLRFYRVKGLFGQSFTNAEEDKRNGTIFLIELCEPPETKDGCSGQKTYAYCVASETDPDPLSQVCHQSQSVFILIALIMSRIVLWKQCRPKSSIAWAQKNRLRLMR